MEQIQTAIQSAYDAKPSEFKDSILSALADKIQSRLEIKRMELAGSIFNDNVEDNITTETEFQSSSEENVDENL
jgi:hypothetical protein